MLKQFNFKDLFSQIQHCGRALIATPGFIIENRLWEGFQKHKGIALLAIIISAVFSFVVVGDIIDSIQSFFTAVEVNSTVELDESGIPVGVKEEGKRALFSGGTKYLLLILLEVIIFYFSVKTLAILRKTERTPSVKDFIKAERRMIQVMIFNFFKGIVALVIVSVILGLIGINFLKPVVMFFVYSYFLGYAFLDNYNEQFDKSLRQSQTTIRGHLGAALCLGIFSNIFLYIPLLGPLLVPMISAIAGTIYGNDQKMELVAEPHALETKV